MKQLFEELAFWEVNLYGSPSTSSASHKEGNEHAKFKFKERL